MLRSKARFMPLPRPSRLLLLALAQLPLAPSCASPPERPAPVERDPRFAWFQALPGTWAATEDSSEPGTRVTYRLSAQGSVLLETIAPGSEHEMLSTIHPDGQRLLLVHYCVLGNQPRMRAEAALEPDGLAGAAEPRRVAFRCIGGTNMDEDDLHMHSAVFSFLSEDHLRTDWELFEAGALVERSRFDLVRVADGGPE